MEILQDDSCYEIWNGIGWAAIDRQQLQKGDIFRTAALVVGGSQVSAYKVVDILEDGRLMYTPTTLMPIGQFLNGPT